VGGRERERAQFMGQTVSNVVVVVGGGGGGHALQ